MATKANGRQVAAQPPRDERTQPLPGVDLPPLAPGEDAATLDAALLALRAQLGEDSTAGLMVKVYRMDPTKKAADEYCDAYPLDSITSEEAFQERIRDEWGGGQFRVRLHDGIALRINRLIRIADRPSHRQAAAEGPLAQQIAELRAQLAGLAQPRESEAQWLERLKTYRELFATPSAPRESPTRMVGELVAVMQGIQELRTLLPGAGADDGARDPSLMNLAGQVIGMLANQANQPRAIPMPVPPTLPPSAAAPAQPSPGASGVAVATPAVPEGAPEQFRQAITGLVALAKLGADPEAAADLVYDQAPEEVLRALEAPDWWARLVALAPELVPHQEWFGQVHGQVMGLWKAAQSSAGQAADPAQR